MKSESRGILRYYHTARTAHLERLDEFVPGAFLYTRRRADFDIEAAPAEADVRKTSIVGVLRELWHGGIDVVEVPEPMAVRLWPQLLAIAWNLRLRNAFRRGRLRMVTYAIENYPIDSKLREFTRLPLPLARWITRRVVGFLTSSMFRIAYGTQGALENYRDQVSSKAFSNPEIRLVDALPSPRPVTNRAKSGVVFLGTFERRKGFDKLCEAWPSVASRTGETLFVLGKGEELIDQARSLALRDDVQFLEDPPREVIWERLAAAKVLVLPSQPARGFKEQVGLPIVEALSVGCEIVASDETGIATWLNANGHEILPSDAEVVAWAEAIIKALGRKRGASAITRTLPAIDGRVAADLFLMHGTRPTDSRQIETG